MSTKSTIWIKDTSNENIWQGIYCHWDGYFDYNGYMLNKFYQDVKKINALIKLGDISSLDARIDDEDKTEGTTEYGVTIAFYRDRNADYNMYTAKTDEEFCEIAKQYEYTYFYDMQENKWYAAKASEDMSDFELLEVILEREECNKL